MRFSLAPGAQARAGGDSIGMGAAISENRYYFAPLTHLP